MKPVTRAPFFAELRARPSTPENEPMKFWLTYFFRMAFRRTVWVPLHVAGSRHQKWGVIKRNTGQIHTAQWGWTEAQAADYCRELNSKINA